MGTNNGKVYDVRKVDHYFADIETAFKDFKQKVIEHNSETAKLIDDSCWVGEDANAAKEMLNNKEYKILKKYVSFKMIWYNSKMIYRRCSIMM